jgi:lysyl-tRNA synthetase class I
MELLPPEVLKYMLLKPDLQENVDIVPKPANMLRVIDDYEKAVAFHYSGNIAELSRADHKRALAAKLSSEGAEGGRGWKTPFLDLVLYKQLQYGWEKIAEITNDQIAITKLAPYVEAWERRNFIPEEYAFSYRPKKAEGAAKAFFGKLMPKMPALEIHNLAFASAKEANVPPSELFEACYQALMGKPKGPKLGKLIEAIGIEKVKKDVL